MTLFWILAVLTIAGALTTVLHRNPVYSALALVFTLFQVAIIFLALDAVLISFLQVIVYAGAIVVLFLFVIMLLAVEPEEPLAGQLPLHQPRTFSGQLKCHMSYSALQIHVMIWR